MPPDEQLVETIESIGATPWSGRLYRHTAPDRDPLSGEGARQFGGRWNPPGAFPTIYLAEDLATCRAEFERMANLQGLPTTAFRPRALHVVDTEDLELLNLDDEAALEAVGLIEASLRADDWSECQAIADGAHFLGMQGIRAPSAAGTGVVVAVFNLRVRAGQLRLVETTSLG